MKAKASQAMMFCFDNNSQENFCFVADLVCFILLCQQVALFLNAMERKRNLSPFASKGEKWIKVDKMK